MGSSDYAGDLLFRAGQLIGMMPPEFVRIAEEIIEVDDHGLVTVRIAYSDLSREPYVCIARNDKSRTMWASLQPDGSWNASGDVGIPRPLTFSSLQAIADDLAGRSTPPGVAE